MKSIVSFLFSLIKTVIIALAVLVVLLQLSPYLIKGYEPQVEAWFEQQGFEAEIDNLSLKMNGYHPEIQLNGIHLKEKGKENLINVDRARLYIEAFDSLLNNQLSFTSADFYLNKAVISLPNSDDQTSISLEEILSSSAAQLLYSLNQFSLNVENIELIDKQKSHMVYNTSLVATNYISTKKIYINSGLYNKENYLLKSQFDIDMTSLIATKSLSGTGYIDIDIDKIENVELFKTQIQGGMQIQQWFKFDNEDIELKTRFSSENLGFEVNGQKNIAQFEVKLNNELNNQLLKTTTEVDELKINDNEFTPFQLTAESSIIANELKNNKLFGQNLELTDIKQILTLFPDLEEFNTILKSTKLQGKLTSVFLELPNIIQFEDITYNLKAENVSWSNHLEIPSINQIGINVAGDLNRFEANILSNSVSIGLPNYYNETIGLKNLSSTISGEYNNDLSLMIESFEAKLNSSNLSGQAKIILEQEKPMFLELNAETSNLNINEIKTLLPKLTFDEDVYTWLQEDIVKADLKNAVLNFSGYLDKEINFDQNNADLVAKLNFEDVELRYDPEWPALKSDKIELQFLNNSLIVKAPTATSEKIKVKNAEFSIKDINQSKARLKLEVNDFVKDQWQFLSKTPLKDEIPNFNEITDLKGNARTLVDANFFLEEGRESESTYKVVVNAKKSGLSMKEWAVELSDINGKILITEDGLSIEKVQANWYEQPVELTLLDKVGRPTEIRMVGKELSVQSLTKLIPQNLDDYFEGKSDWDINLEIQTKDESIPLVKIDAQSSLRGTKVKLPKPLEKNQNKVEKIELKIDVFTDSLDVAINWRNKMSVKTLLKNKNNQYELYGADLLFGKGQLVKSVDSGIDIKGSIEEADLDKWMSLVSSVNEISNSAEEKNNQSTRNLMNSVDITAKKLLFLGSKATNTKFTIVKQKSGFEGKVDSSMTQGKFFIPFNPTNENPVIVDLERINFLLEKDSQDEEINEENKTYKTDQLPSIKFSAKSLAINDKHFKNINFDLDTDVKNHLELKTFTISHNAIVLNASGGWVIDDISGKHQSNLFIDIDGPDLGKTLIELGVGDVIEDGAVSLETELYWAKPFWDVDFNIAKGSGTVQIDNGYLKDVEPGAGRFVGLLSLSALPRRLTLDFSDFFKEGLEFDKIKGDFTIHSGSMWTENLNMKGSVSEVKIVGRTGIVDQDYDQQLTIIPQVSDALPVLSSIVAGSSVGWAVLLFQKLFEKPVDESVKIKYKVSGQWDSPKIDLIEEPKPENLENDESNS